MPRFHICLSGLQDIEYRASLGSDSATSFVSANELISLTVFAFLTIMDTFAIWGINYAEHLPAKVLYVMCV